MKTRDSLEKKTQLLNSQKKNFYFFLTDLLYLLRCVYPPSLDNVPLVYALGNIEVYVRLQTQTEAVVYLISILLGKKYSWSCQSVGYYGDKPCQDAAFSEDGSLLAVAYDQVSFYSPNLLSFFTRSYVCNFVVCLFIRSFVPSFLRSIVPSFLRSFVPSFLRSFVPSFLRSFVPSFLRSFVPSFHRSFVPSFLRSFVPSFLRSFVPSFLLSFVRSFVRSFIPSFLRFFCLSFVPSFV